MRVLVGCEYSGRVRNAFREAGHDAWSCDLLPSEDDSGQNRLGPSEDRWKERSRTFAGVAKAMAEQWGRY